MELYILKAVHELIGPAFLGVYSTNEKAIEAKEEYIKNDPDGYVDDIVEYPITKFELDTKAVL